MTDKDQAEVRRLLGLAGRRAALAVALLRLHNRLVADAGGDAMRGVL